MAHGLPPRFSIVIPCFNQGQFIDECLASIAAQTLAPHEVIVVNDGSTDPWTTARLRAVCVPPVQLIEQENRGLSGARNTGIRRATGDWIVPLDCDDQLTPDALASYAEAIAREPEVGIWCPDVQHFGTERAPWPMEEFNAWHELNDNLMICSSAIHRDVFERARYNERMRAGFEDWEFYIHACCELGVPTKNLGRAVFRYRKWGYSMLSGANARREQLKQKIREQRPIFSDEARLTALKQRWSPCFAIATDGERIPAALVRQSFRDCRVVDRTGRVTAEQGLAAFRGELGRYVFVAAADAPLARAMEANPFLLENLALLCESRSPSLVWLVTVDADAAYPGSVIDPETPAGGTAPLPCVGYLVSTAEFFGAPRIPRQAGTLAEDVAAHLRATSSQPELCVVVGATSGDEPMRVPAWSSPAPARRVVRWLKRWRPVVGAALDAGLGTERKERFMRSRPVRTARSIVSRALVRRPSVPASPVGSAAAATEREGPLDPARLAHRGKRRTDWLVATEPARFAPRPREDTAPAVLFAVPWITHGGADRAVVDLIRGLARQFPKVRRYVVRTQRPDSGLIPLSWAPEVIPNVDGYFSLADLAPDAIEPALATLVDRLGVDVLFIEQSLQAYQALPLIRQQARRVRVVSHLHSFRDPVTGESTEYPMLATSRYDNLIDAYATVSKTLADELTRSCYASPTKVHPVFLGIDAARFRAASRERFTRPPIKVLWLARLSEEKDPCRFLEVARAWRAKHGASGIEFLLVGGGPLRDEVRAFYERHDLQDVVRIVGAVNDAVPLYTEADCLMMTSKLEGIPLVIFEAMAAGLPIVTTARNTAIRDVLGSDDAWIIEDQADTAEYVSALERMLADPGEARARARRLASRSDEFTIERYVREMAGVLLPDARSDGTPAPRPDVAATADAAAPARARDVERMHGLERDEDVEYIMHLHRYRVARVFAPGREVLDFGTGDGYGADLLASVAARVLGTDVDRASIEEAARKYRRPNLEYRVADAAATAAFAPASFDLITCFEVIEHVDETEQRRLVAALARLLRPGGIALISTPDATVKARVYERFPAWKNPFHVRELTAGQLRTLLGEHFAHVTLVPQTVEIGSVMGLPVPAPPNVDESESWVNVAFAGHKPIDLSVAIPALVIPARKHLLQDLLSEVERRNAELAEARRGEPSVPARRMSAADSRAEWLADLHVEQAAMPRPMTGEAALSPAVDSGAGA